MDYLDANNGNNWDDTWNINNDNVADSFYTWPDNNNTTESSNWDTPDDNTVVASPANNFLDDSFNWSNNDFDDFFENSFERFKSDLLRVFTDFYCEWQGPSSDKTLSSRIEQKQIVNVNEIDGELVIRVELPGFREENIIVEVCRDDTRGGDVLIIMDNDWDIKPLYGRFLGTIVFPYKIDTGKSQLFFDRGILEIKVFRVDYVLKSLD